jgi:hypothetical protein
MADSDDRLKPDGGERVFVPQKPPVVPQANPAQPQGQPETTPAPAAQPAKEGTGGSNAASQGEVFHFVGKESMVTQKPPVLSPTGLVSGQAMVAQKAPVVNTAAADSGKATQRPQIPPSTTTESKQDQSKSGS